MHTIIPHATTINIGFFDSPKNPLVRTQNPFTTDIITNNANRADIYAPGTSNILCICNKDNNANTQQNPNVVHIICIMTLRDNNGADFPWAGSNKYSLYGGSPPNAKEFKLSITIFINNICTAVNASNPNAIGKTILKITKAKFIGNWNFKKLITL